MLYKLRSIISCGSIVFFIVSSSVALAIPAKSQNQTTAAESAIIVTPSQTVPVNVNLADTVTLEKIKGMSKKKAQAIIDYRTKNGPFKSIDELLQVKCRGIHKSWLDKIGKFLTV